MALPGVPIADAAKCDFLRAEVLRLWRLADDTAALPAPLPVSLTRDALATVASEDYLVGAKLDGTRCLLLLTTLPAAMGGYPAAVLLDRAWRPYQVPVEAARSHFALGSLFDGELVNVPVGAARRDVLYIFDVVALRGACLTGQRYMDMRPQGGSAELPTRWAHLPGLFFKTGEDDAQLRNPALWDSQGARELAKLGRIVCRGGPTYLAFHVKHWFKTSDLPRLLRCGAQDGAPQDGLVFMPAAAPMGTRRTPWLFKWKSQHTIDVLVPPGGGQPLFWSGDALSAAPLELRGGWRVPLPLVEGNPNAQGLVPVLLECAVEGARAPDGTTQIRLVPVRTRTDKEHPNDGRTVAATIMDCLEPVTLEDILAALGCNPVQ